MNFSDSWQANKAAYDMVFKATVDFFCLKAAYDLQLFDVMEKGPADLDSLAQSTGTVPLRLGKFLTALEQIGLVAQADGKWSITPLTEQYFVNAAKNRNQTMLPFLDYIGKTIETYYLNMADVVRGNRDFTSFTPYPPKTIEDSMFYETLHRSNLNVPFDLLKEKVDLSGVKNLVDIGSGIGDIAISICKNNPEINATLVNLPSAQVLVDQNVAEAGLTDRIKMVSLDMYRDPWVKGDGVIISRILYPMPLQICELLIKKAYEALEPGGKLVILDLNISDPQNPNYDYLTHYLSAVGTDFAPMVFKNQRIYLDLLQQAGFGQVSMVEEKEHILLQAVKPRVEETVPSSSKGQVSSLA